MGLIARLRGARLRRSAWLDEQLRALSCRDPAGAVALIGAGIAL